MISGNTTVPDPNCSESVRNPTISTSNNRLSSTGWEYDAAGNTKRDGSYSTFTYDGENKQVLVKNSSNVTRGEYWYDGDGKRVKKKTYDSSGNLTEDTIFVYDATGRSIAEYSAIDPNQGEGGSAPAVAYLTNDHLGSPRVNTNASGAVTSRHDYHPFGEEIATSQRTSHPDYSGDAVRKQFTGYERDIESDLDYAQMRMYSKLWGRFTSPDRRNAGADMRLPQSWNGYAYVLNNPLILTDPTGLMWLRQLGTDEYTWIDDDEYKSNLKKDKNYYKGFVESNGAIITARGGTAVDSDPSLRGQRVILASDGNVYPISDADLERGTVHIGQDTSPIQQMLNGTETVLWWGRPAVYAMTIPVCLPAALPGLTAGGGSAAGGAILGLGLRAAPAIPTGVAALNQLLNQAQRVPTPTTGWTQMTAQGNAQQIFDNIAQGGQRLASGAVQLSDGRTIFYYQSTTPGSLQGPTIQVQSVTGYITTVRVAP